MLKVAEAAITIDEFCQSVKIGKTHFFKEKKSGRIRTVKSGRRTLVPADEPQRYLKLLASLAPEG